MHFLAVHGPCQSIKHDRSINCRQCSFDDFSVKCPFDDFPVTCPTLWPSFFIFWNYHDYCIIELLWTIVSDRLRSPLALKFFPCLCAWLHRPSPHLAWHSAWPLDEPCGLRRKEIAKDFNVLIDIWCIIMYSVYRCKCASRKTNPFGATVHLDLSFPLCHSASGSKMLQDVPASFLNIAAWAPTSFGHYMQELSIHQCSILPVKMSTKD